MIKFEKDAVYNFENAIRGMRNPLDSWEKSDSFMGCVEHGRHNKEAVRKQCKDCTDYCNMRSNYHIGDNDMDLALRLIKAGSEHCKFLRQIFVSVDITAPFYWWKEFDTYKVGTVANSCSTMHKIADKEFTLDDFSFEHLLDGLDAHEDGPLYCQFMPLDVLSDVIIPILNKSREKHLETKDKKYWWQMIQLLPTSYNQKRTVTMNYQNLMSIYKQRKGHKLDEWSKFRKWIESLPYTKEFFNV